MSEKVDDVFEINQEIARIHAVKQFQRDREEERYMMEIHFHKMTLIVRHHRPVQETVSLNRSCFLQKTIQSTDVGIQTDICCADRPKLRVNKKKATEEIKSTCATVSAVCGVSVEISRKCVQIVAKNLYDHNLYLTASAQAEGECDI